MKLPLASVVASTIVLVSAVVNAQSTATISFGTSEQTIRGFGGSEAWMPQFTTAQANALFGTGNNQLGLSILRLRIDPSSTTGGSNWATELANAQMAHSLGATVIATPWTPPAAWKSSNSTVEGTLNTSEYAAYAGYLNAFTAYLSAGGVPLYAISMQNEPDANVTYESCVWTGTTMDTWVANNAGVLTTKLMMPESESFITSLSDPALNDANAVGKIAIIAGHIYGVSPSYYANAENKGKEVWETEHYLTPSGSQPAISDALAAAGEIHASMVTAEYNAYLWWWLWDWNPGSGNINYGLIDTSSNPTYYGLALAQFSKFVRPGYVRVNATANPASGVDVSAYSGGGQNVIVAINANSSASSVTFDLTGSTAGSFTPFQTSASNKLAQLSAVTVSSNAFTYSLPAQSITTFVSSGTVSPSFTLSPSASTLSVTQGSTATDTVSVTDVGGFTGSVTLSASGLPSGVTATFGTNPTTGSSVVTFTAGSTATTGSSTVTINGVSGSTTGSTSIALTVNPKTTSGFSLSPSASSLTVMQSASGTDTIAVTDIGGFTGSVTFTASGMPSGVTAAFSPTSSTSTSVLTLTASSTATTGAFTITVTGTSGSTTASTTLTLNVTSSGTGSACTVDYTISPQNSSQFGAAIKIINGGSTTLSNWTLTWSFANGQTIASSWNGAVSQSGANVTVSEQSGQTWENIPAGGSYSGFGFNGTWNGTTNAIPAAFSLNGTACTVN
ncbi:MAG: cellulose binding domain-containing protein [Terracidiphilus sp.]